MDKYRGKFLSKISFKNINGDSKKWIAIVTLYDESEQIINRNHFIEDRWKFVKLPMPEIKIKIVKEDGNLYVSLSTDKPAFFVDLYSPNINFSDRGFILLPSEDKKLMIIGERVDTLKLEDITIFSLNNMLQQDELRETTITKIKKNKQI